MSGIKAALGALNTIETKRSNLSREQIARDQQQIQKDQLRASLEAQQGTKLESIVSSVEGDVNNLIKQRAEAVKAGQVEAVQAIDNIFASQNFQQSIKGVESIQQSFGIRPGLRLRGTIDVAQKAQTTGAQDAAREAEESVIAGATTLAALDRFAPEGTEQRAQIEQVLGLQGPQASEFFQLLDRNRKLVAIGEGNSREAQLIAGRLNKMSSESDSGMVISVGEDGSVRVATGSGTKGLVDELSANQTFKQSQRIGGVERAVGIIDDLITQTKTDALDFGTIGSLRSTAQSISDSIADLSDALKEKTGGTIDLRGMADFLGIPDTFDPDLPGIQRAENELAVELAKLRLQKSGGGIRALGSIFDTAREDVKMQGLGSAGAVRKKLQDLKAEFDAERDSILRGLSGSPAPVRSLDEVDEDELENMTLEELEALRGN